MLLDAQHNQDIDQHFEFLPVLQTAAGLRFDHLADLINYRDEVHTEIHTKTHIHADRHTMINLINHTPHAIGEKAARILDHFLCSVPA